MTDKKTFNLLKFLRLFTFGHLTKGRLVERTTGDNGPYGLGVTVAATCFGAVGPLLFSSLLSKIKNSGNSCKVFVVVTNAHCLTIVIAQI